MTTKAAEALAKEMADKTSRVGMIVESAMESMTDLKRFIKALRDEGCSWDDIGKVLDLPGFAVRIVAGEIARRRPLPEYQRAAKK
jgi:glutaredoxin-related protein